MSTALSQNWNDSDWQSALDDDRIAAPLRIGKMPERLTLMGIVLFAMGASMIFSATSSFRPSVAGLSLHPCQMPLLFLIPLLFLTRLSHFPAMGMFFIVLFTGIYCAAIPMGPGSTRPEGRWPGMTV